MSVVSRIKIKKSLVPGVHAFVGLSYGQTPEEHKPLFDISTSTRAWEEDVVMSGMGSARVKEEGAAVEFDDIQEAWAARYQHETVALGFAITKEAFDDDLYDNVAKAKSLELGRAMADTKQVKGAAIYNRGFNGSYVGGDGQPLFSDDHPTSVGTFSNKMSADLSETAIENAIIKISLMENDRGILISASPKSLHIPAQLQFRAQKILQSTLSTVVYDTSNGVTNTNEKNVIGQGFFPGGTHINRRFTDPDAWFIRTNIGNSVRMFTREALGMSDDTDFHTDNLLFKFRERYSFGWTDPRGVLGSEGS